MTAAIAVRQSKRIGLPEAVALIVAAVALGLLVAPSGPAPRVPAAPASAQRMAAEGGVARITVPAGWSRAGATEIPGLALEHPLALRHGADGVRLAIGEVPASRRDLLPAGFAPGKPDVTTLGSGLRAWRYGFVGDMGSLLVLWVVPTSRGAVTIGCLGRRASTPPPACEAVARTVTLTAAAALEPTASAAFWNRLPGVLTALEKARTDGRADLAAAPHGRGQAAAATQLAAAYRAAAAALAPLAAEPNPTAAVQSLKAAAGAYDGLAAAARGRRKSQYAAAGARVAAAERTLAGALSAAQAGARAAYVRAVDSAP